jgi:hypothetical protein
MAGLKSHEPGLGASMRLSLLRKCTLDMSIGPKENIGPATAPSEIPSEVPIVLESVSTY